MFHKTTILLFALLLSGGSLFSQTINWATDVAPILYDNCVKCHRSGGLGHFSLIGYSAAYDNMGSILDAVENRQMPPWQPNPEYRHYVGENLLSDTEIETIRQWVEAGGPEGDISQAPAEPVFSGESEIGMPDDVFTTPLYTITATDDEYRCFVIPSGLAQDAFLRGVEILPGNHEVVHHVLIFQDTSGAAMALDAQTPEPGYVSFGGVGVQGARLISGWAPGARAGLLPPFMGIRVDAGADLVIQIHYPKGVTGMSDQTRVNFFYTPTNQGIREVRVAPLINHTPLSLEDGPLYIPANEVKTYHAKYKTNLSGSIISVGPHMHLIGRSMICFAVTLQNDTIPLIDIPEWDFHWQGSYTLQRVEKIPAGSTIHAYATYDNTPNNPFNPSDPPQDVSVGEATTDEMMLVYFAFMQYQSGDEDILLDSTLLTTSTPEILHQTGPVLQVSPNPAGRQTAVQYTLDRTSDLRLQLLDAYGRAVRTIAEKRDLAPGIYRENIDLAGLPAGTYVVQAIDDRGGISTRILIKNHTP